MVKFHPVDDLLPDVGRRLATGNTCTIPTRQDYELRTGEVIELASWGSPAAYKLIRKGGKTYGVPIHREYELAE